MKLYLLSQSENSRYDTYDSCVVCAKNEEEAKKITPDEEVFKENGYLGNWALTFNGIKCEEIGTAAKNQKRGLVIASYHAG